MKIIICAQHLDGNDSDGFNAGKWLTALETEYREIAMAYFPEAEVIIDFDRQTRSSGYTRPVSIDFEDDDNTNWPNQSAMIFAIEQAGNTLYDLYGQEFFDDDEGA